MRSSPRPACGPILNLNCCVFSGFKPEKTQQFKPTSAEGARKAVDFVIQAAMDQVGLDCE
jgi:hypothetical protein